MTSDEEQFYEAVLAIADEHNDEDGFSYYLFKDDLGKLMDRYSVEARP